ncbi:hypothetical protein O3M35_003109 [Rhynocoris fuscipes]
MCMFLGPIVSALCNQWGFRIIMISGGLILSLGYGLCYFSTSYTLTLFLFGIVAGTGGGFVNVPNAAPVGYWFDKRRPIALGFASSGGGIGMLLIPYTTERLIENRPWLYAFIYHATLFALYILLGILLIPLKPVKMISDQPTPGTSKARAPTKKKIHNKYHQTASQLFPPESLKVDTIDPWMQASMSRVLLRQGKPVPQTSQGYGNIVRTATLRQSSSTSLISKQSMRHVRNICGCCKRPPVGHRPLYKSDLFYQGSIYRLQHQDQTIYTDRAIDYAMFVTKLPTRYDIAEEERLCVCYPESVKRTLYTMFDFSVMKEYSFLLFLLSNFFFTMGSCLPTLYICQKAAKNNLPNSVRTWLVPTIGIGVFFGRFTAGVLLQLFPLLHAFHICLSVNIAVTLLTFAIIFINITFYYFFYTTTYGIFFGIFTSIRSLIIVDYLGLDRLTSATGVLFFFSGCALLIGPPAAENIKYHFAEDYVFYFAGTLMSIAFLCLLPMMLIKRNVSYV